MSSFYSILQNLFYLIYFSNSHYKTKQTEISLQSRTCFLLPFIKAGHFNAMFCAPDFYVLAAPLCSRNDLSQIAILLFSFEAKLGKYAIS